MTENNLSQAHFKAGIQGVLYSSPVETDGWEVGTLAKTSTPGELEAVRGEAKGPALGARRPDFPIIVYLKCIYLAATHLSDSGPLGPSGCSV